MQEMLNPGLAPGARFDVDADVAEITPNPTRTQSSAAPQVRRLPLTAITLAPECQLRAASSAATVADYADALAAGAIFPPIVAFDDGERVWLADGFHRLEAHQSAGLAEIAVDLRDGTRRDAVLYAAGANATHGLRRTQADKARAIAVLLADPEWRGWSDKELGRRTGTSDKTVAKARRELSGAGVNAEIRVETRTFITRHGTEAQRRVKPNGVNAEIRVEPNDGKPSDPMVDRILRGLPDDLLLAECRRRGLVGGA
jgi:ParB-like chromosome segregation protein Spo0J